MKYAASILFIEDILISIDISLRLQVLPMLLERTQKYQLFILSHDRGIFNMVREFVESKESMLDEKGFYIGYGVFNKDWVAYELLVKESPKGPIPIFKHKASHLERAKAHLNASNIPECANALRQCCEAQLKKLLGSNCRYEIGLQNNLKDTSLRNLIALYDKEREAKGFPDIAPSIDGDRERILNPFSHDDIETPYYREELKVAIQSMTALEKVSRRILIPLTRVGDKIKTYSFFISRINNKGDEYIGWVKFCFRELLDLWEYNSEVFIGDPEIMVISVGGACEKRLKKKVKKCFKLKSFYRDFCSAMSINASQSNPLISELIDDSTHSVIRIV